MSVLDCANCGMTYEADLDNCPKCDFGKYEQNLTNTLTRDIAHNRQTVRLAEQEFYRAIEDAKQQGYGRLRLIVGGGIIREETQNLLDTAVWQKNITGFEIEHPNKGAFLVRLGK